MAKAVLFIHGFMGCAKQFNALLDIVRDGGHAVESIALPGHGKGAAEFRKCSGQDWQNAVDACIDALRTRYDEIQLCTHSMGGLLAIRSELKSSEKITGIFALMLPLRIHVTRRTLMLWLRIPHPAQREDESFLSAAREALGITLLGFRDVTYLLPGTLSLLYLIRKNRKRFCGLAVSITMVHSRKDEIVSPRSIK